MKFNAHIPVDRRDQGDATHAESSREAIGSKPGTAETLDEVLQRGALKMLQEALEAEVDEYLARHRGARDERLLGPIQLSEQRKSGAGTRWPTWKSAKNENWVGRSGFAPENAELIALWIPGRIDPAARGSQVDGEKPP